MSQHVDSPRAARAWHAFLSRRVRDTFSDHYAQPSGAIPYLARYVRLKFLPVTMHPQCAWCNQVPATGARQHAPSVPLLPFCSMACSSAFCQKLIGTKNKAGADAGPDRGKRARHIVYQAAQEASPLYSTQENRTATQEEATITVPVLSPEEERAQASQERFEDFLNVILAGIPEGDEEEEEEEASSQRTGHPLWWQLPAEIRLQIFRDYSSLADLSRARLVDRETHSIVGDATIWHKLYHHIARHVIGFREKRLLMSSWHQQLRACMEWSDIVVQRSEYVRSAPLVRYLPMRSRQLPTILMDYKNVYLYRRDWILEIIGHLWNHWPRYLIVEDIQETRTYSWPDQPQRWLEFQLDGVQEQVSPGTVRRAFFPLREGDPRRATMPILPLQRLSQVYSPVAYSYALVYRMSQNSWKLRQASASQISDELQTAHPLNQMLGNLTVAMQGSNIFGYEEAKKRRNLEVLLFCASPPESIAPLPRRIQVHLDTGWLNVNNSHGFLGVIPPDYEPERRPLHELLPFDFRAVRLLVMGPDPTRPFGQASQPLRTRAMLETEFDGTDKLIELTRMEWHVHRDALSQVTASKQVILDVRMRCTLNINHSGGSAVILRPTRLEYMDAEIHRVAGTTLTPAGPVSDDWFLELHFGHTNVDGGGLSFRPNMKQAFQQAFTKHYLLGGWLEKQLNVAHMRLDPATPAPSLSDDNLARQSPLQLGSVHYFSESQSTVLLTAPDPQRYQTVVSTYPGGPERIATRIDSATRSVA